ncbi:MAG TPA: PEGA domain-containing protein [Kofleriaceae bacterium]|nr:PEGA domain-containing protein [Kofleriaceae bacterium]
MPGTVRARSGLRRAAIAGASALALALAMAPARPAAAQPSADRKRPPSGDKKEALRHLARGDRQLQRGDQLAERNKIEDAFARYEAALTEYQAAYAAYPDPQINYPIAQAEQRMGRFLDALQHYQGLLADPQGLSPELRSQIELHLGEVRKNLAALVLDIEPDGATILVDGEEKGESPMSQPLFLEPGQHSYEVTREGYQPDQGVMDLTAGKETRKRIHLERVVAKTPRPRRRDERAARLRRERELQREREAAARRPNAVPLWIGVGVTGALVLGGTATGIGAVSKHSQYADESLGPGARESARTDGKRLAVITDVLLGTALVGAGVTAYYYFAVYRPRSAHADEVDARGPERDAGLELAPVVGGGMAGLAVSGTFW